MESENQIPSRLINTRKEVPTALIGATNCFLGGLLVEQNVFQILEDPKRIIPTIFGVGVAAIGGYGVGKVAGMSQERREALESLSPEQASVQQRKNIISRTVFRRH